tara:strand:+ start:11941 stop:12189 length:249 start_codon:yes stop_codon:yes gene_type:complete
MSSIRWIRTLLVDDKPVTVEIMIGSDYIADKCYVRVNSEPEFYYTPDIDSRDAIVAKGIEIIQQRFKGKTVLTSNGQPYLWN